MNRQGDSTQITGGQLFFMSASVGSLVIALLSSCGLKDWSSLHHQRLYERYRLIANHELSVGNEQSALLDFENALREQELAHPPGVLNKQLALFDSGRMFLVAGNPKKALECFDRVDDEKLRAETSALKGFCYLQCDRSAEAACEFSKAQELYKLRSTSSIIKPFPVDACPNCCAWGLTLCRPKREELTGLSFDQRPVPSQCLSSRILLSRKNASIAVATGVKKARARPRDNDDPQLTRQLHSSWTACKQAGESALSADDFETAEKYFLRSLSLMRKSGDKGIRLSESLRCLSKLYSKWERRDQALPYLREELELKRNKLSKMDAGLIEPLRLYALALLREGDLALADEYMSEAITICDTQKHQDQSCARLHANCCELRLAQDRFHDAEVEGLKSLDMFAALPRHDHRRVAVPKFMIAKALIAQDRMDAAEDYLQECKAALDMRDVSDYIKLDILITQAELSRRLDRSSSEDTENAKRLLRRISLPRSTASRKALSVLRRRLQQV